MTIPRHAIAIAILSAAASRAAVPFAWDVPDYPAASARAQAWRGETLDLRPRWQADTNGLTFAMLWQTNGMGAAWFQDASDAFTWSPSKDCGAPSYRIFIRALGPSGASYRANLQLDILDAPGAAPNALPLPVPSIDFAALAATNAPWLLPPATNALALCLRSDSPNDTLPPSPSAPPASTTSSPTPSPSPPARSASTPTRPPSTAASTPSSSQAPASPSPPTAS